MKHSQPSALLVTILVLLNVSSTFGQSPGSAQLLREGQRQLALLKTSKYQHKTDVSEPEGRFNYDCSGFLDYALRHIAREAYAELPISKPRDKRPLAQDFYTLFSGLSQPSVHWQRVRKPMDLVPGDIVSWLRPPDNDSHNTGHVMLVRDTPRLNPREADEVLIPVMDSTRSPHAQDSRSKDHTGLGTGTIGVIIDAQGLPVSYRWRGGQSKREETTPIAFGRLL